MNSISWLFLNPEFGNLAFRKILNNPTLMLIKVLLRIFYTYSRNDPFLRPLKKLPHIGLWDHFT